MAALADLSKGDTLYSGHDMWSFGPLLKHCLPHVQVTDQCVQSLGTKDD